MALERVRGKRSKKAGKRASFLRQVAAKGSVLFKPPVGDPFKNAGKLLKAAQPSIDRVEALSQQLAIALTNATIDISRQFIVTSDALTDLAAEVSPLDKRAERVIDAILDYPIEAYFKAWIFTLEFYLDAVETAKATRKERGRFTVGKRT